MLPAEHHGRIAGSAAVGACAQSPPHAERIHDRHPSADIEQPLDKALRGIGFARAGGTDDRDPVIEGVGGKSCRQNTRRLGRTGMRPALADADCCVRWFRRHGRPPPAAGTDGFVHD
jgi:hypothetical protein